MKFTVTSGAASPKSSTVLKARKLPSSTSSGYLGASETTFASLMRTAGVELRRICAGWQPTKLRCCPMNQG